MKTNISVLVFIAVLALGAIRFEIPSRWFGTRYKIAKVRADFNSLGAALRSYKINADSMEADLQSLSSALRTYKINTGRYPSTEQGLQALVERPTTPPLPDDWVQMMTKVPTDPLKNEYRYRCFPEGSPHHFELISNGPDGIEGTKDDRSMSDQSHPNSKP